MVMGEIPKIRVDNYDIIRTIGKGNFASVKLARHRVTKTEVAIKIIEKFRLDQSDLKKIYREIQILKLLRHPHIIKLYEVIETKTKIYLVCEYASNGEVFDYITQEERIPEDKARKMFYQVLTAIEYCHKHNVVHRDLKAENLLLDANNNIKLADFGFGNFFQSGQNLNTWCGSPPYAAPEVFEGKLYEGPQLDIWSLGIVLYVLVCGTFPFDGSNLASLKDRVLAGRFRIPYWMSQDCENLIRRMLVVNPKKRLTIAQIKKHKWIESVAKKLEVTVRKCVSPRRSGPSQLPEFNEHILKIMQGFGFDRLKTLESLRNSSYNYLYAVYHLLVDRLKHHRTSVPVETRFTYDGGKRRPSNIAEQTMSKHIQSNSPTTKPPEPFRFAQKSLFYNIKPGQQLARDGNQASTADDYTSADTSPKRDIQFIEETGNDVPPVQRTLKLSTLPLSVQAPVSPTSINKSKFLAQPYRGPLPHQPWSFNSGFGIRTNYYMSPHTLITEQQQSGGDVIPSVSSIDEGVELRSASPSELEMMKLASSQQRRHTLGIPGSFSPFSHLATNSAEMTFNSKARGESQADSLFGSSGVSNYESETLCDSTEISYDTAPRVVLSPCLDESVPLPAPADLPLSYIEKQRQLLNVSPTGFREGRRASDGLLLLADGRLCEHLKRLSRADHFPPLSQDENDDNCFETCHKERDNCRLTYSHLKPEMKVSELGAITSHSSHHVMQLPHADAINYQPYASPNRRRSFQVAQYLAEERCSSYSKGFERPLVRQQAVFFQPPTILQHSGQEQQDVDQLYQWSSWKAVTENEFPNSDNLQQRRDTVPFVTRENMRAFPVWSDESMGRISLGEKSIRQSSLTGIGYSGGPRLVQILQKRKLNRRRNIALNSMSLQQPQNYQLQEFEQLKIVDSTNTSKFVNPDSVEELAARFPTQTVPRPSPTFESYRGISPELNLPAIFSENHDSESHLATTIERSSPIAFTTNPSALISSWGEQFRTDSPPITYSAMEYS